MYKKQGKRRCLDKPLVEKTRTSLADMQSLFTPCGDAW